MQGFVLWRRHWRGLQIALFTLLVTWAGEADAQLRIVTYNTAGEPRQPHIETVIRAIGEQELGGIAKPVDVWLFQEHDGPFGHTKEFVDLLNSIYGPGIYAHGNVAHLPLDTNLRQTIAYNTQSVALVGEMAFGNFGNGPDQQPRQTMRYHLRPVGYESSADFFAYNSHYKASDGTIDQQRRLVEATSIRNNADALGEGVPIIYAGDFNMQRASQEAFQTLIAPGPGQAFDPIDRMGNWHMNPDFADVHTQSPCTTGSCPNGFTGGGMDDRFDFQLVSAALLDGGGLNYIDGSYHAFGNNGTTFNANINDPGNTYEFTGVTSYTRTQILDALWNASDHLPVVADYQVPAVMQAVAGTVPATLPLGQPFQLDVTVGNAANVVAAIGADLLSYSLTTSGNLAGTYLDQTSLALSGGNTHFLTLDTSTPGMKSGVITLASTSKQVANGLIEIPVNYQVLAGGVQPEVVARWTFEASGPSISGTGTSFGPMAPEEGAGAASGAHASQSTVWSSPVGNGSSRSFSSNNWAVGDYYEFQVSTAGLSDIGLTLDHTSSGTGPKEWGILFSTTGTGQFDDTGITYSVLPNSSPIAWSSNPDNYRPEHFYSFDLSHITELNDQETLFLRLVSISDESANDGTVAAAGTSRVDNVTIFHNFGFPIVGLPGDFNGDGVVDAADYTLWRDGLGTTHTADGFDLWKANFGATADAVGAGSAMTAAVPEPSAALLLLLAACLASLARGRLRAWIPTH